jgi:hypothetical protein
MCGNIVMPERQEEKSKSEYNINRGFELMLRKASKEKKEINHPKKFQIKFGKIFSFLDVEFSFNFDLYLDFKKSSDQIKR